MTGRLAPFRPTIELEVRHHGGQHGLSSLRVSTVTDDRVSQERLQSLVDTVGADHAMTNVLAAIRDRQPVTVDGVVGSACALIAAVVARKFGALTLVLCGSPAEAEGFADDLTEFSSSRVEVFPAWLTHIGDRLVYDAVYGDRLRILKEFLRSPTKSPPDPLILVASVPSLMQPVPPTAALRESTRCIQVGEIRPIDEVVGWLVTSRFQSTSGVELPGEFSRRGGILDIFAADWQSPMRLEWFDDQLESIRRFDVDSQRSHESLTSLDLTLLPTDGNHAMRAAPGQQATLLDYLPDNTCLALLEPDSLALHAEHAIERSPDVAALHPFSTVLKASTGFRRLDICSFATARHEHAWELGTDSVERFHGSLERLREELDRLESDAQVLLCCPTEAEIHRLRDVLAGTRAAADQRLHFQNASIRHGFQLTRQKTVVLSAAECLQRGDLRRRRHRHLGKRIDSFLDLKPGELVVHLTHGIGRFRGMEILRRESQVEEHLVVEFAEGTKIYVPSTRIQLIQKYVGGKSARPRLATLGGVAWQKKRQAAEAAVTDLAQDLLAVQAERAARPGIVFAPDSDWQREFDAAFLYDETDDQLQAIDAIKRDMELSKPMDRLLCGDVGFGKTEIAIRAAFKAVDNGYQVAVLVPTTILAEQHFRTFSDRMREYPFTIARLSRFCSSHEERQIVEGLATGGIDIVIGTHRLASADIHFHNLGLLIIDEEQRFGVGIKERLKALRSTVDVLTMTATPIPRTLHMSLTGMRDISNLEHPPAERNAVETRLTRWDDQLIRRAILREIDRGGQVFFVHNRIADIHAVGARLQQIVPDAHVRIAHGQMPEDYLEEVMTEFVAGQFDVLLATTIIESGLDIPNANTIFLNEAQRYGLAELHQLRGRVGRFNRLAYCYLLVDSHRHVTPEAARRLRAIEEFSYMGAGFAIAMRDLEFRGAGNVLGPQQSGHIAAVGYELYCELLEAAVRRLQALPPKLHAEVNIDLPGEAYLPDSYVANQRAKIDLYRRLARIAQFEDLQVMREEMRDRFGELPTEAERLLDLSNLRLEAAVWGIDAIHLERKSGQAYLVLHFGDLRRIQQLVRTARLPVRIVDECTAYVPIPKGGDPFVTATKVFSPAALDTSSTPASSSGRR